ncbi:MAG: undecaprenyl diphosphate synthase family protein, partial [Candidatus Fonsibacter sp.]
ILIRTGGEKRLSNFLLWQLSYAELFFINKNWPDFNFFDLKKVIKAFGVTKRKFGGLNEKFCKKTYYFFICISTNLHSSLSKIFI